MFESNQVRVLLPSISTFVTRNNPDRNNNLFKSRASICRCLFGVSDPLETQRLVEQEDRAARDRLLRLWSFDVTTSKVVRSSPKKPTVETVEQDADADVDVENAYPGRRNATATGTGGATSDTRRPFSEVNVGRLSVKKNLFPSEENKPAKRDRKPYTRQSQLTDFWRERRNQQTQENKLNASPPGVKSLKPRHLNFSTQN